MSTQIYFDFNEKKFCLSFEFFVLILTAFFFSFLFPTSFDNFGIIILVIVDELFTFFVISNFRFHYTQKITMMQLNNYLAEQQTQQ